MQEFERDEQGNSEFTTSKIKIMAKAATKLQTKHADRKIMPSSSQQVVP